MAGVASIVRRMYLITYNWLVCAGWFLVLYIALKTLIESAHMRAYEAIEKPLLLAQSAAFFEILHSVIGLVRSPISAALPQISSRLYVVWGIVYSFPEVQPHPLVSSMIISWCITEIIRYSFFGVKETFGSAPFWLLWLRYSTFLILYPLGIGSEVSLINKALPYIKESGFCSVRMLTNGTFHLITSIVRSWCLEFTYQGSHICMVICLDSGKKLYANQVGSEKLADDHL